MQDEQAYERNARTDFIGYTKADDEKSHGEYRRESEYDIEKQVIILSKIEKMKARLLSEPKDYTFDELETLLKSLGFILKKAGKTNGSAVKFIDSEKKIL